MRVRVVFMCSQHRSDWLTLVADLCETILVGGPLWTQFDDTVVLAVEFLVIVFFVLLSPGIVFQIYI